MCCTRWERRRNRDFVSTADSELVTLITLITTNAKGGVLINGGDVSSGSVGHGYVDVTRYLLFLSRRGIQNGISVSRSRRGMELCKRNLRKTNG